MPAGMSMGAEQVEAVAEPAPKPRVLAVEVGGWPGLGGRVRVELGERRTVLVGKNGVGKSLLMTATYGAARAAVMPLMIAHPAPLQFLCRVGTPDLGEFAYEYERYAEVEEDPVRVGEPLAQPARWYERCWSMDRGTLWQVKDEVLTLDDGAPIQFAPGAGFIVSSHRAKAPPQAGILQQIFFGISLVHPGVLRTPTASHREILVHLGWRRVDGDRAESMAHTLVATHERKRQTYDEFVEILRTFGLVRKVEVKLFTAGADSHAQGGTAYASVLFDGVNIGYLSDGTLRVCEIVLGLLSESASLLLIEEPETAVHPGLLHKLLAVVDSYVLDRQVIVSTHSPIVVDWCRPSELRLVEREDGVTSVRALSADDVQDVEAYLNDQGTFANYVYSRSDG
jgi:AAA domain, putative AbiEii toxin, Type IV TA system